MKYYAAVANKEEIAAVSVLPPIRILASYYIFKKKIELIKKCIKDGNEMFIDSGAFSAENKGAIIDIDDYCKYVIETGATVYAGLDVIGDPVASAKNIEYMERVYGLHPIPTFHMGGSFDNLRKLFGYPYIALGGMVFAGGRREYCDEVWSIILREAPGIKVHGFGMTNLDLMERYPWYSVDSSTYKDGRRFGRPKMLSSNMEMVQMKEDEFRQLLIKMGYKITDDMPRMEYIFICDVIGVWAYKIYGDHLDVLNKYRNFDHLTSQNKLF